MTAKYENENGLIVEDRLPSPSAELLSVVVTLLGKPPLPEDLSLLTKFNGCTLSYGIPLMINGKKDVVSFSRYFRWCADEKDRGGVLYEMRMRDADLMGMLPIARDDGGSVLALNINSTRYPARAVVGRIREIWVDDPAGGHYVNETLVMKIADSFPDYLGKLEYSVESTINIIEFLKSRGKDTNYLQREIERFRGTGWGRGQ